MTAEFIVALHAIEYLYHKKMPMQSEEIAENVCTNSARIRKIMLKLKSANIIETFGGASGGYAFNKSPSEVSLYDIFMATNKKVITVDWRSGSEDSCCPISKNMEPIIDDIFNELEQACLQKLKNITIKDIDNKIFKGE